MIDLHGLVSQYGYLALFVGTFLEGETILILGGLAAQQGLLELPGVMAAAFAGSLLGDQFAFLIGRKWGRRIISRFPTWQEKIVKIQEKSGRYLDLWMLSFRFFWGLRNPTPFVLAMGNVSQLRFASLNAVGALVWAVVGAGGGYLFGNAMEGVLGDVHRCTMQVLGGFVGLWVVVLSTRFIVRRIKRSRARRVGQGVQGPGLGEALETQETGVAAPAGDAPGPGVVAGVGEPVVHPQAEAKPDDLGLAQGQKRGVDGDMAA